MKILGFNAKKNSPVARLITDTFCLTLKIEKSAPFSYKYSNYLCDHNSLKIGLERLLHLLCLSSEEVYYYQTRKFVILGENIRQKRTKNDRFKNPKTIIFVLYFLRVYNRFACLVTSTE